MSSQEAESVAPDTSKKDADERGKPADRAGASAEEAPKPAKIRIRLKLPTKRQKSDSEASSSGIDNEKTRGPTVEKKRPAKKNRKLIKLPIQQNRGDASQGLYTASTKSNGGDESTAIMAPVSFHSVATKSTTPSKRKTHNTKPLKLPAIGSPGLLMQRYAGRIEVKVGANGLAAPQDVFAHHMALAGYTLEGRTKNPHRGSSVQRVVDDLFDSDVKAAIQFPALIPADEWMKEGGKLVQGLATQLEEAAKPFAASNQSTPKKRRLLTVSDMAPVSLTVPISDDLRKQRKAYWEHVDRREEAVVRVQQIEEDQEYGTSVQPVQLEKPVIPPIPSEPPPPAFSNMEAPTELFSRLKNQHPLYPPEGNNVSHLDPNAFHVSQGRYFGLRSNHVVDPSFVGPNAPGVSGASSSLATASYAAGSGLTLSKSASFYPERTAPVTTTAGKSLRRS